jgi:hypothetical protein
VQMGGSANFAAAIALYDCVVRIETAALGSDHLETATALSAKALVQMGGSANLAAAEALYDRDILNADHPLSVFPCPHDDIASERIDGCCCGPSSTAIAT